MYVLPVLLRVGRGHSLACHRDQRTLQQTASYIFICTALSIKGSYPLRRADTVTSRKTGTFCFTALPSFIIWTSTTRLVVARVLTKQKTFLNTRSIATTSPLFPRHDGSPAPAPKHLLSPNPFVIVPYLCFDRSNSFEDFIDFLRLFIFSKKKNFNHREATPRQKASGTKQGKKREGCVYTPEVVEKAILYSYRFASDSSSKA